MRSRVKISALMLATVACAFIGCAKQEKLPEAAQKPAIDFFALSSSNQLLKCNGAKMGLVEASMSIAGLQSEEQILSIDFRPATGEMYGVSNQSRIYIINTKTGMARAVAAAPFMPPISSNDVSIDFNPTVDRIRLVTATGQNLRLNPETGTVAAVDGNINGVAGVRIEGAAYTNNMAGASSTILYDIDVFTKMLYKQDPPNNGGLIAVGRLNAEFSDAGDMDITPDNKLAMAVLNKANKSTLYLVNLETGAAKQVSQFAGSTHVLGIAIPTDPVAFGINTANQLVIFNPVNPNPVAKNITGLAMGEMMVGLDFRPANGQLYAISNMSKMYTINASSGAASPVSGSPLTTLLAGTNFGFDFNPTVDRIRLVSNTGQNLRLNPLTGGIAAVDMPLNPGMPMITAAAYTNNVAGATTTTLMVVDAMHKMLYKQIPPNDGMLAEGKMMNIDISDANGFDIGGTSGKAWLTSAASGTTALYEVNIATGNSKRLKTISTELTAFTVGLGF